jgi:hypothetical protein
VARSAVADHVLARLEGDRPETAAPWTAAAGRAADHDRP